VTVVKTALQLMGNDCGAVRAPGAWPLRKEAVEQLQELLNTWRTGEPQRMLR
jgi:4-hydroxy-tetrahydrodipicolinate synthase